MITRFVEKTNEQMCKVCEKIKYNFSFATVI